MGQDELENCRRLSFHHRERRMLAGFQLV